MERAVISGGSYAVALQTSSKASAYAWLLGERYEIKEGRSLIQQTLASARRVLGDDHPITLGALTNYAMVMNLPSDPAEMVKINSELIDRVGRVYGTDSAQYSGLLNNYGTSLQHVGVDFENQESQEGRTHEESQRWFARALEMHEKAIELRRKLFGPDHFWVYQSHNQIALALSALHRNQEAEIHAKLSWDGQARLRGTKHNATMNARNTYALILYRQDKYDAAEVEWRAILKDRLEIYGEKSPGAWAAKSNLGTLLLVKNEPEAARGLLQDALDQFQAQGDSNFATIRLARKLANCLDRIGKAPDAEKLRTQYNLKPDPLDWNPAKEP